LLAFRGKLWYKLCAVFGNNSQYGRAILSFGPGQKEEMIMQENIQPKYYQAKVTCNCGNEFITGSTKPEIHVEICSKCHPYYTGQQKAVAARGRIEQFNRKYGLKGNN